jgi:hypothetical protein
MVAPTPGGYFVLCLLIIVCVVYVIDLASEMMMFTNSYTHTIYHRTSMTVIASNLGSQGVLLVKVASPKARIIRRILLRGSN